MKLSQEQARAFLAQLPPPEAHPGQQGIRQLRDALEWAVAKRHPVTLDLSSRPLAIVALRGLGLAPIE